MPRQRHFYGGNHLHFITASTYRRAKLFDSLRFRRHFIRTLAELRAECGFKIVGYVLMPEHFHLLIGPSPSANPSRLVQSLKERTAKFILANLQARREHPWCARMLAAVTLPPSVHLHGPHRVWQRCFYDLNVWSEQKRLEKLNYMHGNPVKRGLASSPDQWPWSSFRFYHLEDAFVLAMDRMP
jgi:putative transposase